MTRISRRTFLCQASNALLLGIGSRILAEGVSQPDSRFKALLTFDLRDATTPEAIALLFKSVGLNYVVEKEVSGFTHGLVQNADFGVAFRMLLHTTSQKLSYSGGSVYVFQQFREPNAPPPRPVPSLIQPSDMIPVPLHATLETMPRRVSGIILWADGRRGAILETGGPFTGDRRAIQEGDLVPSGVTDEPNLRVQWIGREGAILSRRKGRSLVVPLTDLTPFRVPSAGLHPETTQPPGVAQH